MEPDDLESMSWAFEPETLRVHAAKDPIAPEYQRLVQTAPCHRWLRQWNTYPRPINWDPVNAHCRIP